MHLCSLPARGAGERKVSNIVVVYSPERLNNAPHFVIEEFEGRFGPKLRTSLSLIYRMLGNPNKYRQRSEFRHTGILQSVMQVPTIQSLVSKIIDMKT